MAIILRVAPGAEAEDAELLLIRRADHPTDVWSGHMAMPGGRRSPGDASTLVTAIREVREEVAIDLEADATLLTRLPDVPAMTGGPRTGLVIAPFVFALRTDVRPIANAEVAEIVWTRVGSLARGESRSIFPYDYQGTKHDLPCYRLGERVVWGLTFQMLQLLFERLHLEPLR